MVKPVDPIDPMAPTGDGKSYLERMQRGMANDPNANPEKAKMFADALERMVNEGKAINEARNEYRKIPGNTRAGGGGGGASGAGDFDFVGMGIKKPKPTYKKGGIVKSASARADGCAIKGKTRGKIV